MFTEKHDSGLVVHRVTDDEIKQMLLEAATMGAQKALAASSPVPQKNDWLDSRGAFETLNRGLRLRLTLQNIKKYCDDNGILSRDNDSYQKKRYQYNHLSIYNHIKKLSKI